MDKIINGVCHFFEYALASIYILAGYSEFVYRESAPGALGLLVSSDVAAYVYTVWFIGMGVALIASKWFKRHTLHKHMLGAMYLTTIYTISLSLALFGFAAGAVVDDLIIGLIAAVLWLRWKFKHDYLSRDQFYSKELPFRTDT